MEIDEKYLKYDSPSSNWNIFTDHHTFQTLKKRIHFNPFRMLVEKYKLIVIINDVFN